MKPEDKVRGRDLEEGTVILEVSIILPVLLLFTLLLLGTGQVTTQSIWYSQTAYQAAFLGAETEGAARVATTHRFITVMERVHQSPLSRTRGMETGLQDEVKSDTTSVTASLAGQGRILFSGVGDEIGWKEGITAPALAVSVKAPLLLAGSAVGQAETFSGSGVDGANAAFDCCGVPLPAGQSRTTSCASLGQYQCFGQSNQRKPGYYP